LQTQPESEARVAELAVPLIAASEGDFSPLLDHVLLTLGMFANSSGDGEWLYNIPNRPVLTTIGSIFFWLGLATTAVLSLIPLWHKLKQWFWSLAKIAPTSGTVTRFGKSRYTGDGQKRQCPEWFSQAPVRPTKHVELAGAFLVIWWLAGISPAFISIPPASLGHTILAQPAVFLLAAVPLWWLESRDWKGARRGKTVVIAMLGLVFVISLAARDWPDYFQNWPERGMVRFLYRADLHELASYVNENEALTDFGVNSLLAGPWDQIAFSSDLRHDNAQPRWFNAERAVLLNPPLSFMGYPETAVIYPDAFQAPTSPVQIGAYTLALIDYTQSTAELICFANGLCVETAVYNPTEQTLDLTWQVSRALDLPEQQIISNPPPPGVYAGPRLLVFAQLLDANGNFLAGDDGLWVDIYSLQSGDVFKQQHRFVLPESNGKETAVFGLYDPMTGTRILTETGQDHVTVEKP
jgi:hypothetical protein